MPALSDLDVRLASDPDWKKEYNTNLPKAKQVQERVPLIHVLRATPEMLQSVFATSPYELSVSRDDADPSVTTKGTIITEQKYNLGNSLYFYAGSVFPIVGGIGLAFGNGCENGKPGDATPFDTGGLTKYINVHFTKTDHTELRFVSESRIPLIEWRDAFGRFLAAYFSPLTAYWEKRPPAQWDKGPLKIDPDGILDPAHNNMSPAWTFEVRFNCNQYVYDCAKMFASEPAADELFDVMKNSSAKDVVDKIASVSSKLQAVDGSKNYIQEMEQWVKHECLL